MRPGVKIMRVETHRRYTLAASYLVGGLLVAVALACQTLPSGSPAPAPDGSTPGGKIPVAQVVPSPVIALTSTNPVYPSKPPRPTPMALPGLKVVELGSEYRPTDLSGDQMVGRGRDGEVYLANVRTGAVHQLTNDGHRKIEPVISGNLIAWTDQRREIEVPDNDKDAPRRLADDIFVLDLNTDEQRRITEVSAMRRGLQFSGHRLVWHDKRNEIGEHYTQWDIYAYDLEADREIAVAVASGSQRHAALHDDVVVWADNRNRPKDSTVRVGCLDCPDNRFDIYLYDFNAGGELVLDASGANNSDPAIHGQHVVWRGYDLKGHTAIHYYDLSTGHKRTLVSPDLSGVDRPLVSGDYVVWTVGVACDVITDPPSDVPTGVFAYDLRTDEVRQLSNYIEPRIILDGQVVVINEGCHMPGRVYAVFLD